MCLSLALYTNRWHHALLTYHSLKWKKTTNTLKFCLLRRCEAQSQHNACFCHNLSFSTETLQSAKEWRKQGCKRWSPFSGVTFWGTPSRCTQPHGLIWAVSGNISHEAWYQSAHSGHYWNMEDYFFLINIFSMSWILMEMTIYKWRWSSWGLSQWSLRICSNWHCFNLYFPHSPVLAHELISLSYIHWTSNAYGSMHFFIMIFRSSGFLRQLFFWFPPVFPDAMWSLKRISQCLTFCV